MVAVQPAEYWVYPTGYNDCPIVDKWHFVLRVVRTDYDNNRWKVTDGDRVLNHDGDWVQDDRDNRDPTRFVQDEALGRAKAAVDSFRLNGGTLAEWDTRFKKRRTP